MIELQTQGKVFSVGTVPAYVTWRLRYDGTTDPYVVAMVPLDNDDKTPYEYLTWEVGRELLARGVDGEAGVGGDIYIKSFGGKVMIWLQSPDGECRVDLPLDAIRNFILDVFQEVPAGTEADRISWDEVVGQIFDWGKGCA